MVVRVTEAVTATVTVSVGHVWIGDFMSLMIHCLPLPLNIRSTLDSSDLACHSEEVSSVCYQLRY